MSRADLPPPDVGRWVPRRKACVIAAIDGGLISEGEAAARYALSLEEIASWRRSIARFGLRGLRVTRLKALRRASE